MRRAPKLLAGLCATVLPVMAVFPAQAQLFGTGLGSDTLQGAAPYGNPIHDDRTYIHAYFQQLEGRFAGDSYLRWDGQAWAGDDYNKVWLKSEGRYNQDGRGRMTDGDHELLYDRPISRFFDVQAGVRVDLDSGTTRTWAALGVQALLINYFDLEATLYASDGGHYAAKINASYDTYLTQRLVLQPQIEINMYSALDRGRGIGGGISDVDTGLRLRYDITRQIAPYVGIAYQRTLGGTEGLTRQSGGKINDWRGLAGLWVWF